jgi:hypothetical protein
MAMQKIFAREILDSRGNPTVEVDLHTAKGNTGLFCLRKPSTSSCPSSEIPSPPPFSSWLQGWGKQGFLCIYSYSWVQGR